MPSNLRNNTDADGQFRRPPPIFRSFVSSDSNAGFPAENDRYALYIHYVCPWAARTTAVRVLKGLEDIIQLIELDDFDSGKGWVFTGTRYGPGRDPLYGFKYLRELYLKAQPGCDGRFNVPVLWDKKTETIVNNESSEIIRMMYTEFDALLPEKRQESSKGKVGLFPEHLRTNVNAMNEWVYNTVEQGVYKLVGENINDTDIRLYPTRVRFDVAYYTIFKCNVKMVRHDYLRLHEWLRMMYWDESARTNGGAFKKTTQFGVIKSSYSKPARNGTVPAGPLPNKLPL